MTVGTDENCESVNLLSVCVRVSIRVSISCGSGRERCGVKGIL